MPTDPRSRIDPDLVAGLVDVVGRPHVLSDPEVVASYSVDWTGRYRGSAPAVVRPADTEQVAAVIALCRATGTPLVVQGGNTGMVGGGVPLNGEVVMSVRRIAGIRDADAGAGQLTASAGTTLAAVQDAARGIGWSYGVDLGGRDSATIGGNVATNAGGLRVLRYGDTRAQVLGVEAALGTGAVVSHLAGLVKDNTGYALHSLLCGSEGTLGVVTAVRLRLVPPAPERVVALLAFAETKAAVSSALELRRTLASVSALELVLEEGVELVARSLGVPRPFDRPHRAYVLVEASGRADPSVELSDAVASLRDVSDVAVALEPGPAAALWRLREGHTEAVNTLGVPHKLDVTLPYEALAEAVERLPAAVARVAPVGQVWLYGHVGDGNLHVNVTGVDPHDDTIDDAVFQEVGRLGGSISAEHGIGSAKRRWLSLNRSSAEIEAFAAIKRALDPDGILNPAVLLPGPAGVS